VWFKIESELCILVLDAFLCLACFPPEESSVYKNENSILFECDLFSKMSADFSRYETQGDRYWCGNLNSRTGETPDFVKNINLQRFVDMPEMHDVMLPVRHSYDKICNPFGLKLLSL
jgi:hypothetical protein